eukprot:c16887_g1_i1.p1 GENE.c16887_g1_i1~~c16887_g1_i1.p1  ORF type:complete len:274 (+),score=97.60 c16887_g1_i1:23-844(+)
MGSSSQANWECGAFAGLLQAVLFNPWDRALYLSSFHKRPFLMTQNFVRPYEGFHQAIVQRVVSVGLYFPLVDVATSILQRTNISKHFDSHTSSFVAGTIAGSVNAVILNPLSIMKYQSWGTNHQGRIISAAKHIFQEAGLKGFMHGAKATICRDMIWGGVYNLLRSEVFPNIHFQLQNKDQQLHWAFFSNTIAALIATIIASPLNYVRNVHYGTHVSKKKSIRDALNVLWTESKSAPSRLNYFRKRFVIGWGTLRVGFGMGFASQVYDFCSKK